jgi:circadian clock protein KaiC
MQSSSVSKVPSGVPGLDEVLHGGLASGQATIVSGGPGSGKTIVALQFLAEGDEGLYIGFEEREEAIRENASGLGIDLSDVTVLDLSAEGERFFSSDSYTLFEADEVEGEGMLERIATAIDEQEYDRLVIDPLSELRALLPDDFQFRRNISSLFNELAERGVTAVCTVQQSDYGRSSDLKFLGNTTVEIYRTTDRRTLEVTKYRGSGFDGGEHTFRIQGGTGARVYPKLVPGDHYREHDRNQLPSGIDSLDELLGGGLERGSVTVISGPSGVGKTTTGSQFLQAAAADGQRALIYLFEELAPDYLYRADALGMDVRALLDAGDLEVEEIESLSLSPDEFSAHVRDAVEERDVEFIVLDGVAGYRQSLRGDDSQATLTRELHSFCRYCKRMGVSVVLIEEISAVTGEFSPTDNKISYLADNIVFLRYLELGGDIRKAIGVLKKRYSGFESTPRELTIDSDGLAVGSPLTGYRGLLTGTVEEP